MLNEKYHRQFLNNELVARLKEADIRLLEEVLARESEELKRYQEMDSQEKLDFGSAPSAEEAKEKLRLIKPAVEDLLGVQTEDCSLEIHPEHTSYRWSIDDKGNMSRSIRLKENVPAALLDILLSHELAHHAQYAAMIEPLYSSDKVELGRLLGKAHMFTEGHARRVQELIGRDTNDISRYATANWNVGKLKSAYIWLCKQKGIEANRSLLAVDSTRDKNERNIRNNYMGPRLPSEYAVGNTLFILYEAQMGPQIYRDILRGDFVFPE